MVVCNFIVTFFYKIDSMSWSYFAIMGGMVRVGIGFYLPFKFWIFNARHVN